MSTHTEQETLFPRPHDTGYPGVSVCEITGITYRKLDYWTTTGLIDASIAPASGSGSKRYYAYRDLLDVKIVANLLSAGLSLQKARSAIKQLRAYDIDDLAHTTLLSDGHKIYRCTTPEEIAELLTGGQGMYGIAIPGLISQLSGQLNKLGYTTTAA